MRQPCAFTARRPPFWRSRRPWRGQGEPGALREPILLEKGLAALLERLDANGAATLAPLWAHWEMVMGEELAALAIPLGHRRDLLIIGADDHLAQQELAFQTDDILERVNAFLEAPRFRGVVLTLRQGKTPLTTTPAPRFPRFCHADLFAPPQPLGALLDHFDPESAIGRCYARCVDYFKSQTLPTPARREK